MWASTSPPTGSRSRHGSSAGSPCWSASRTTTAAASVAWSIAAPLSATPNCHVVPALGARSIQQLQPSEIDDLYVTLEARLSPRTVHHVHTVLGACLKAAVRKGVLTANPVARAEAPSPGESDRGIVLDQD